MKSAQLRKGMIIGTFVATAVLMGVSAQVSRSASLSDVSVTLSNSRPSFRGGLETGNTASTSQVIVKSSLAALRTFPSGDATQLIPDDTVTIIGSTSDTYGVTDVLSTSSFTVDTILGAGHIAENDLVISTQSAALVVNFDTTNALNNGSFRVLVPGGTTTAVHGADGFGADGRPDGGHFDYGDGAAPTVTCDDNGAETYGTITPASTARSVTIGTVLYHSFVCDYTSTGGIGDTITITIEDLINPAPVIDASDARVSGVADTFPVLIQHRTSADAVFDSTTVKIGVVEAVRITASVAPQITFEIEGVADSETRCGGVNLDVTTTATTVPFGELTINQFQDAAQDLTVTTNAVGGYSVTASMNDQLGRNGVACAGADGTGLLSSCIRDASPATMNSVTQVDWSTPSTEYGFGYSLENSGDPAEVISFEHNTVGTFAARHFADRAATESPVEIFGANGVANTQTVSVCYRANIEASQAAGNYENSVMYTATATF